MAANQFAVILQMPCVGRKRVSKVELRVWACVGVGKRFETISSKFFSRNSKKLIPKKDKLGSQSFRISSDSPQ